MPTTPPLWSRTPTWRCTRPSRPARTATASSPAPGRRAPATALGTVLRAQYRGRRARRCRARRRLPQKETDLRGRPRRAEQKALAGVAACIDEELQLLLGLHALGH